MHASVTNPLADVEDAFLAILKSFLVEQDHILEVSSLWSHSAVYAVHRPKDDILVLVGQREAYSLIVGRNPCSSVL